ncbi:hypothetical protein BDZ97DRAFT_1913946 [Flammula alnicola]|nr:hypothetical protein BDZ97DRAFT_1766360 [Flammula alnicola]KAF8971468.1 hypothetical protein BDZ97DRAFT_1913946 [Flammula alnicola]
MPPPPKTSSSNNPSWKAQASAKENPARKTNDNTNLSARSKSQLSNTTNVVREAGHRQRKPSEKVQQQIALNEEAAERRKAEAARKEVRVQRNAPDTEDEEDAPGEHGTDDEEEPAFTSRPVSSKLTEIKKRALLRSEGRMPIPRDVADADASSLQDEDRRRPAEETRSPRALSLDGDGFSEDEDPAPRKHRSPSPEDLRDAQVPRTNSNSRPKTADYDEITKQCIVEAIREYRCRISANIPFPDHADETTMARDSWDDACHELDVDYMLTPRINKVITNRGSHTRGELKTKARPIVETFYSFESGQNRKIIAKNRGLAEALKDEYGYAYKVHDADHMKRKGLYKNPLIQKIINTMWFRNRQDEGVIFEGYFRPIRPETIALVLTVIDCCIDEWITGIRTDVAFSGAAYRDVYIEHLKCLKEFDNHAQAKGLDILGNIREKLYNRGRFHAGAQPLSQVGIRALPTRAFDAAIKEYEEDTTTESDGETGFISD